MTRKQEREKIESKLTMLWSLEHRILEELAKGGVPKIHEVFEDLRDQVKKGVKFHKDFD